MSKNERTSNPEIPAWWLAKALPLLDSPTVKHADVARIASKHADRANAWDQSAISRFKAGIGRTVALTNGISVALQIPQPFFTAPTERAASEIGMIVRREEGLSVADGVVGQALRAGAIDADKAHGASSIDGAKGGYRERTRRVRHGRP